MIQTGLMAPSHGVSQDSFKLKMTNVRQRDSQDTVVHICSQELLRST